MRTCPHEVQISDARLLTLATERMARYKPGTAIPEENILAELGLTKKDLDGYEEVEIE